MTWIAPNNFNLATITGSISGLGLNPISTFDIYNIFGSNSPLVTPFYVQMNQFAGLTIAFFSIVGIYYSNYLWTQYIPINTNGLYDNTGSPYNVSAILSSNDKIDEALYQQYSPPFYSAAKLVVYGAFFMIYPAMVVYAILHYRKAVWDGMKDLWGSLRHRTNSLNRHRDPFSRSMMQYKECPEWWFVSILVVSMVLSIVMIEIYKDTETPVWIFFLGVAINLIFIVPFGILYAMANLTMSVNVLIELIIGYAVPGNGNALMIGKAFATNFLSQTDNYITNQKQAHYCRLPPRALFRVQILSVLVSTVVNVFLINWQLTGIDGFCTRNQKDHFICANARTFFSASVTWGVIGPKKVFGGLYPIMKYCFLIGAVLPIPFFFAEKYIPKVFKNINIMLILAGTLNWAPLNFTYFIQSYYISWIFNYFIRRRYISWWQKYNYLLHAALVTGTAYGALILFFSTGFRHKVGINWWGNSVSSASRDSTSEAKLLPPDDPGYFGPEKGHFP